MAKFFDRFPTISYDISRDGKKNNNVVFTNILLRLGILEHIKTNMYAYYDYIVPEGETIEILAHKYYGDSELHWVIMLANDMTDPFYDWPLDQLSFSKYIEKKYGSIATAQTRTIKWYKVITRTHLLTNTQNVVRLEIQESAYDDLAESSLTTYTLDNGEAVEELITRESTDAYTWESNENDRKRYIKLIKREYIPQIQQEFANILRDAGVGRPRGFRTFRERL